MLIALLPARALATERSSVLLLTLAAPAEEAGQLEAVTRELLDPLDVQLEIRLVPRVDLLEMRRAPAQPYFARVWIALSSEGSARLYLEHGASDRLLVRDVPGDAGNPELVREELGHILQAAVEGLKAGEQVGEPRLEVLERVAPVEPPPLAKKEPPLAEKVEPRRSWLRFGARYEARWLGDGARVEDGPGAVVALATRFGAELSAHYRRPLRVEKEPIGARFEAVSLRALVTVAPREELRLGAGVGADLVRVTPIARAGDDVELSGAAWRRLATTRWQATYAYRAFRALEVQISAGADVDVSRTRYVLQRSEGDVTVLEPSPLRPFVSLGAAVP